MSDEEDIGEEEMEAGEEEEEIEATKPKKVEVSPEQEAETRRLLEQRRSQVASIDDEEIREYMEQRMEQRQKEEEEIMALRAKIKQRKAEREEEERRMEAQRKAEEEKRRQEEEERREKKAEEERQRADERMRKREEAENRMKNIGKRNFVITKKDGTQVAAETPPEGQEVQKSKEQLEAEKKAILAQRIQPLSLEGLDEDALRAKAKELHQHWYKLEGEKYDLEQEFKRKQYDLMELAERARQVNKGKGRQRGMSIIQIESSFDRSSDKHINAPPKIMLCSKYERVKDRRTYDDRKVYFESGGSQSRDGGSGANKEDAITEEGEEGEGEE